MPKKRSSRQEERGDAKKGDVTQANLVYVTKKGTLDTSPKVTSPKARLGCVTKSEP